jgi:hypothetical protein
VKIDTSLANSTAPVSQPAQGPATAPQQNQQAPAVPLAQ